MDFHGRILPTFKNSLTVVVFRRQTSVMYSQISMSMGSAMCVDIYILVGSSIGSSPFCRPEHLKV